MRRAAIIVLSVAVAGVLGMSQAAPSSEEGLVARAATPLTIFEHQRAFYAGLGLETAFFGHPLASLIEQRAQYNVELDPESEAIVTIGAKDALAHLLFAVIGPDDAVVSPNPAYPIHQYGVIMAEGHACMLPMPDPATFLNGLEHLYKTSTRKPKMILISFPHNPTTHCVDLQFFRDIVGMAARHGTMIVHDFAYADICFDGYRAPSLLEVDGAKEIGIGQRIAKDRLISHPGHGQGRETLLAGNPWLAAHRDAFDEIALLFDERVLGGGLLFACGQKFGEQRLHALLLTRIDRKGARLATRGVDLVDHRL